MDEGSHGRRMVCKELDVTSTHELSHTHPLCHRSAVAPAGKHWEYGNLRRGGLNCIILWNTFGKMEIQPVSLPLPDLLCSTGGIAAGSWLSLVFRLLFCIFVHVFVFVSELSHAPQIYNAAPDRGLAVRTLFHLFVIISTLDLVAGRSNAARTPARASWCSTKHRHLFVHSSLSCNLNLQPKNVFNVICHWIYLYIQRQSKQH